MCQAYQSEASYVIWKEERDHKAGKPYGCSFQAGYFQCPNEYNQYCLSEDVIRMDMQYLRNILSSHR